MYGAAQIAGGQLLEVPNVSKLGFWEAAIGAVTVDDNTLNLSGRTAILDTGTSESQKPFMTHTMLTQYSKHSL